MAHHGNTPAAWTGVVIVLVGFAIAGLGLIVSSWLMFWIGVILWPVAGVVVKVMQRMGLGADTHAINADR
jgi:hypothetical protein